MFGFVIHQGKKFGGLERRYARLFENLLELGYDARLYCTSDAWETISVLCPAISGERVFLIDNLSGRSKFFNKINRLSGLLRLLIKILKDQPCQVHLAMNPNLIGAVYGLCSFMLPNYSIAFVDPTFAHQRLTTLKKLVFRLSTKCAVSIDCLSPGLANFIKSNNLADFKVVKTAPCSFTDLRQIKKSLTKDIDVLFIARFSFEKGLDLLESAWELLAENKKRKINLHVCGFGDLKPKISGCKIYQAQDSFDVMSRAKIFLSIQKFENYPSQALLEAIASGCAIIATNVGETRLIVNERSAVMINYEPKELADAVTLLLQDGNRRLRLVESGARSVQRHTIENYRLYFLSEILVSVPSVEFSKWP